MSTSSVWVVVTHDAELVLVASTAEAAKRHAANYCGQSLVWAQRNSMFDHQERWVAEDGSDEYHVHEEQMHS